MFRKIYNVLNQTIYITPESLVRFLLLFGLVMVLTFLAGVYSYNH